MKRVRAFQIELEFESVGFQTVGKTGVSGEKPLGARERTNNKLNPHMVSMPGFEPRPHVELLAFCIRSLFTPYDLFSFRLQLVDRSLFTC